MTKTDKRLEELERRLAAMEKQVDGAANALSAMVGTVKNLIDNDAAQRRQVSKLLDIVERAVGVPDGATVQ